MSNVRKHTIDRSPEKSLFHSSCCRQEWEYEGQGYQGNPGTEFNYGKGCSCPSRMWQSLAESYYYPILSQIGSLGTRGVAFQHFKNATAWFLDPMKQEIKHEETMIYEMYANDSSREAAFFFSVLELNKYNASQNRSHITENRGIRLVRR